MGLLSVRLREVADGDGDLKVYVDPIDGFDFEFDARVVAVTNPYKAAGRPVNSTADKSEHGDPRLLAFAALVAGYALGAITGTLLSLAR